MHTLVLWYYTRRPPSPCGGLSLYVSWLVVGGIVVGFWSGGMDWSFEDLVENVLVAFLTSGFSLLRPHGDAQILERAVSDKPAAIDVGAASAQSFWSGYLEDVLEDFRGRIIRGPGDSVHGTMGRSSLEAGVFLFPRLVILIPQNCDVIDDIEGNLPRMREHCPTLTLTNKFVKDVVVHRAGVQGRSMGKHCIYSIEAGGRKTLFPMEWATPCRTMEKMRMSTSDLAIQVEAFHHRLLYLKGDKDVVFVHAETLEEALKAMFKILTTSDETQV